MFKREIYADYASTTPLSKEVRKAMRRAEKLGNSSAIHREGVKAKKALEEARALCARAIESRPEEIYFTSGGTESNNIAIVGVIEAHRTGGVAYEHMHVITTPIEHSSVIEAVRAYEKRGVRISFADVNEKGIVSAASIEQLIRPETILVSVMYANNEIGTVQPIHEIGEIVKKAKKGQKIYFHTDACQAPLFLPLHRENLRVDMMSLDGHKIYGPRGVGMLFVKNGTSISPIMHGGGQERGLRPTTENVPGILGMAAALRAAARDRLSFFNRMKALSDLFVFELEKRFPEAIFNGDDKKKLPHIVNISLPWITDPEFAVIWLSERGIYCSTKSSCLQGEEESYVVKALDRGHPWRAKKTLRFSFGTENTKRDILAIVRVLAELKAIHGSQ